MECRIHSIKIYLFFLSLLCFPGNVHFARIVRGDLAATFPFRKVLAVTGWYLWTYTASRDGGAKSTCPVLTSPFCLKLPSSSSSSLKSSLVNWPKARSSPPSGTLSSSLLPGAAEWRILGVTGLTSMPANVAPVRGCFLSWLIPNHPPYCGPLALRECRI